MFSSEKERLFEGKMPPQRGKTISFREKNPAKKGQNDIFPLGKRTVLLRWTPLFPRQKGFLTAKNPSGRDRKTDFSLEKGPRLERFSSWAEEKSCLANRAFTKFSKRK